MLVLSRNLGQRIIIGERTPVKVVGIGKLSVSLEINGKIVVLERPVAKEILPNVSIALLGTRGRQARFAIDAPKSISIHREEILQRIFAERRAVSA